MSLTIDVLLDMQRRMREIGPAPMMPYPVPIATSSYALQETNERNFPVSKNRSRRIHKKLCKRFGGEFKKAPAIFQTPRGFICHPSLYASVLHTLKGPSHD